MVIRTRRAALRDRTPVTNTPTQSPSKTKERVKGKVKGASAVVSKKRKPTPPPTDAGVEDEPIDDDEPVQTHGETEKSQEEFSIGGFSFEDSQQSGMGLPGLGLGESVILQSTPAPSWRRRQKTSQRASSQLRSASIMKQPAGLKASSPLPPSSPMPTSPLPSSRPIEQEPEPEHRPELIEEAPSEHLSDDPFGFFSAERKLRAKRGQPMRVNKGKAVDRFTPTPEPASDDDDGIEDLYASGEDAPPRQRHQTTPPRQPSPHSERSGRSRSSSLTSLQSPHTPSTPNKPNSNKRKPARSRDSSPDPSAAPTSPSPSKPRVRSKPSTDAAGAGVITRGRTRKKRKSEEMREEEEEYDEEMDPSQIAEHLEALLPKPISKSKKRAQAQAKATRRSSRKTARRGKAPTPSSSEDESEPPPPRRPASKRGGKKPASRTGRAKKDRDEDEDVDLDELEVGSFFLNPNRFSVLTFVWFTESASRAGRVLQEIGRLPTRERKRLRCVSAVQLAMTFVLLFFWALDVSCYAVFVIGCLLYCIISRFHSLGTFFGPGHLEFSIELLGPRSELCTIARIPGSLLHYTSDAETILHCAVLFAYHSRSNGGQSYPRVKQSVE